MGDGFSLDVLLVTLESITNNDLSNLSTLLSTFPLADLDVQRSDTLLARLLDACAHYDRKESAHLIYEAWAATYPSQETEFFSTLFKNTLLDPATYEFLARAFPNYSFLTVASDLCRDDSNENLIRAMDNLFYAYKEQTADRLDAILQEADSTGNFVIYNYMVEKLKPFAPQAPPPPWLKNFRSSLPREEELENEADQILQAASQATVDNLDQEKIISYLTDGMALAGLSFENIEESRRVISAALAGLSLAEVDNLLEGRLSDVLMTGNLEELQDNVQLFRILGPSNPQSGAEAADFLSGQDRMFLCSLYDYDDEEDKIEPWFTRYCQTCNKKIAQYWQALRVPRSSGGWSGCYCSFDCARQTLLNEEIPKVADLAMLDRAEELLLETGIQDRL